MQRIRLVTIAGLLPFLALATRADAQGIGGRRFGIAVYAGASLPTGSLKNAAGTGWHAGGYVEMPANTAVDIRLDGVFSRFANEDVAITTGVVELAWDVFIATLGAELNLGQDSAAYPGDNSVSPWIIGGAGVYRFDIERQCVTGTCTSLEPSSAETRLGINIGVGGTVPLAGVRTFLEGRYHIVFPKSGQQGNTTMALLSAGLKFR